ncbi:MAG: BirA family biotin operon repressor/biotin-[acetyl-CoA-carboxylase] ligase [Candidatus Nitrosomirales archaeon]|jgi:BirA family biotin operon repressor/biotin-[acetyl-CoA-carboxylase] ligase
MVGMQESIVDAKHLEILKLLKKANGRYVSGERISKDVKVSRVAIWKHVSALRKYGYRIESKEGSGYKLIKSTNQLLPWEIKQGLKTKFVGKQIHHYALIDSTQDLAIRLAENNAQEGTVVVAEKQKKGRARVGRRWAAPEGGIWISTILRPKIPTAESTILPLAVSLAVGNAIRKECKLDAKLKWPNDIIINGKKVSGILAEMSCEADRINYVVIGIGVNANVNVKKLEASIKGTEGYYGATSLMKELGKEVDRVKLMRRILDELEETYLELEEEGSDIIIRKWKEHSATLGTNVTVALNEMCFVGKAIDIDYDGALLVKLADGNIKRIVAGDVYVRMAKTKS